LLLCAPTGVEAADPAAPHAAQAGVPAVEVELSLDEAVRRAVESNEEVLLAQADQRYAESLLSEVRSALRPNVDLDLDYTRNIEQPVFFLQQNGVVQEIQVGSKNEYDFSLSLTQPLFDARVFPALRATQYNRDAALAGVADRRTAIALGTRIAWYDVLLAGEQVEVQRQALQQASDRLRQVEELYGAGTAAEFDVLTASVEVDNLRPALIQAENDQRIGRERLKRIVGLPPTATVRLAGDFTPLAATPSLDEALETAFATRSDLRALELAAEAQEQRIERERRSNLPHVDLVAEVRRQASTEKTLPDELVQSSNAQIQVSVPLFQGGARKARVEQEKASLDSSRLRVVQLGEDIRLQVQQALLNLRAAREAIEASRSNVARAARALEIGQVRFKNGLSTQLELSDAELAVTQARSNYAAARYAYSVAWARLQAALGEPSPGEGAENGAEAPEAAGLP
jgi:outer membrane protein TolC